MFSVSGHRKLGLLRTSVLCQAWFDGVCYARCFRDNIVQCVSGVSKSTLTYVLTVVTAVSCVLEYRRAGGTMQLYGRLSDGCVIHPHHLDVPFLAVFLLQGNT